MFPFTLIYDTAVDKYPMLILFSWVASAALIVFLSIHFIMWQLPTPEVLRAIVLLATITFTPYLLTYISLTKK